MKIHKIENRNGEVFYVKNKKKFCEEMNLTPRLLDYTKGGFSREQEYHKDYKIVCKMSFIESEEGEKTLWDSGVKGYTVAYEPKPKSENVEVKVEVEITKEDNNDELNNDELEFVQKELSKALKQKQKLQDRVTLLNKLIREDNREQNTLDILKEVCVESYKGVEGLEYTPRIETNQSAVLVISDVHIGQIIDEYNNCYNLEIATERLDRIFVKFIKEVETRNICDVSVLLLGDLIHAGSITTKPDMKLSSQFPEIISGIKCFELLASQIDRLVSRYNVSIAGVIGNESRFNNHINPSNIKSEARNNVDLMIFEMLKQRYIDTSNVVFLNEGDELESVVEINNKQIAMVHGNNLRHQDLEKATFNLRMRLEKVYGEIDMVVLGHIHSTSIGNKYARNGSIPSASPYSNALGIVESYVSQNMLIIDDEDIKAFSLRGE